MFALRQESSSLDQPDIGLMEAYTPELREQMLRLEKENEILKRRLDSGVESPIPGSSNIDEDSLRKKVSWSPPAEVYNKNWLRGWVKVIE